MQYTDTGSGPAVVLLDGLPWRLPTLRESLARQYRVLDVPIPGFGEPTSSGQYSSNRYASIRELAGALDEPLDSLGVGRHSLIGVSFGANVAFWRALSAPERVEALILVSPTCLLPTGVAEDATEEDLASLMLAHPEQAQLPKLDPAALSGERALVKRLGGDSGALGSLADLRCATLAVFGQEDRLVSPEAGRLYRERAPNCNVCFVYDAGHAISLERPESSAKLTADFLERRETFVVENRGSVINP